MKEGENVKKKSEPIKQFIPLNRCFSVMFVTEMQTSGCARYNWDFQGSPEEMLSPACCRRIGGCGYLVLWAPDFGDDGERGDEPYNMHLRTATCKELLEVYCLL